MRKVTIYVIVSFFLFSFSFTFGQSLPQLGNVSYQLEDRQKIIEQGKKSYLKRKQNHQLHESIQDVEYLNYLSGKISVYAPNNPFLYLYIVKDKNINAFATPGGYIGINTGLILATDNEHELAGVVAHEIAHVALLHIEHAIAKSQNRKLANLSAVAAGIAAGIMAKDLQLGAGIVTSANANEIQNRINDIRGSEIAADDLAQQLLEDSGFDQTGLHSFFNKLESGYLGIPDYLRTHPIPSDRIAKLGYQPLKSLDSSDEFYLFKSRVAVAISDAQTIEAWVAEGLSSNRGKQRDAAQYMSALLHLKLGNTTKALGSISQMQTNLKQHRDVLLLQSKLYDLNHDVSRTRSIYSKLWKEHRGDEVVALQYARFLASQHSFDLAKRYLKPLIKTKDNSDAIQLYAQILFKQGDELGKNQLLMDFYEHQLEYSKALFHAKKVLSNSRVSWQQKVATEAKKRIFESAIHQVKDDLY